MMKSRLTKSLLILLTGLVTFSVVVLALGGNPPPSSPTISPLPASPKPQWNKPCSNGLCGINTGCIIVYTCYTPKKLVIFTQWLSMG
jgi:hypothetical protein